jgi:hypothetical protein
MDTAVRKRIENTNWLAHRWPIKVTSMPYGGRTLYMPTLEGHEIGSCQTEEDARKWIEEARPQCLARWIAGRPSLHPADALIVDGKKRLARIPPDLWCGYDVLEVQRLPPIKLISAKARAIFPDGKHVLIVVAQRGEVRALGLMPASASRASDAPARAQP